MAHSNDMSNVPAAACGMCGGWTSQGGMSTFTNTNVPVEGSKGDFRTGCDCHSKNDNTFPTAGSFSGFPAHMKERK